MVSSDDVSSFLSLPFEVDSCEDLGFIEKVVSSF